MTTPPKTLSTGLDLIDHEHEYLHSLLNRLQTLCVRVATPCHNCDSTQVAQCDGALSALFSEVFDFMIEHFRTEEALMQQNGFPTDLWRAHVEEHADIGHRIQSLVNRNPNQIVVKPADFHQTIRAWLDDHIAKADMQVANFLRETAMATAN